MRLGARTDASRNCTMDAQSRAGSLLGQHCELGCLGRREKPSVSQVAVHLEVSLIGVYDEARREYAVMKYAARARRRRIGDARCLPPGLRPLALAPQENTPHPFQQPQKLPLLGQQPLRRPVPRVVDGVVPRVHDEVGHGPVARARVARVQNAVIKREERPAGHARRHQFEVWR